MTDLERLAEQVREIARATAFHPYERWIVRPVPAKWLQMMPYGTLECGPMLEFKVRSRATLDGREYVSSCGVQSPDDLVLVHEAFRRLRCQVTPH